jgi:hypothetical protein
MLLTVKAFLQSIQSVRQFRFGFLHFESSAGDKTQPSKLYLYSYIRSNKAFRHYWWPMTPRHQNRACLQSMIANPSPPPKKNNVPLHIAHHFMSLFGSPQIGFRVFMKADADNDKFASISESFVSFCT